MPASPPKPDTPRTREGPRAAAAATASRLPANGSRPTLFAPLRTLLAQKVQLQRRGFGFRFILAPAPAAAAATEVPVEPTRGAALRDDHRRLAQLLRRHSDLRRALRHLACVEQTLAREGSRALQGMPAKVLRKAIEQIEGLHRDDPAFALPELMRRLKGALALAEERTPAFETADAMDISEASHSLFDEMERSWNGRMPVAK